MCQAGAGHNTARASHSSAQGWQEWREGIHKMKCMAMAAQRGQAGRQADRHSWASPHRPQRVLVRDEGQWKGLFFCSETKGRW